MLNETQTLYSLNVSLPGLFFKIVNNQKSLHFSVTLSTVLKCIHDSDVQVSWQVCPIAH